MIKSYLDTKVKIKWCSPNPGSIVRQALTNTMHNIGDIDYDNYYNSGLSPKMIKFLFTAEHSSVMEHAVICFEVQGASRSWLAQITRHRISSPTSSSQHYQNYTDYDNIVHPNLTENEDFKYVFDIANLKYEKMIREGIPKEEARQILPEAKAVNFLWTINARSLYNFMRLRMCYRNVAEIQIFADRLFLLIKNFWWPEYATVLGPPCYIDGKCNQGSMTCGKKFIHIIEDLKKWIE